MRRYSEWALPHLTAALHTYSHFVLVLLMCSTTITKCDFPDPSVEFYEDYTGFKTSISGLSLAVTGEIMAQWGIMWVFLNLYPAFKLLNNEAKNLFFFLHISKKVLSDKEKCTKTYVQMVLDDFRLNDQLGKV